MIFGVLSFIKIIVLILICIAYKAFSSVAAFATKMKCQICTPPHTGKPGNLFLDNIGYLWLCSKIKWSVLSLRITPAMRDEFAELMMEPLLYSLFSKAMV